MGQLHRKQSYQPLKPCLNEEEEEEEDEEEKEEEEEECASHCALGAIDNWQSHPLSERSLFYENSGECRLVAEQDVENNDSLVSAQP